MRRLVFSVAALWLAFFAIVPTGLAQIPGNSLNAAVTRLFGTNTAFTAKADVQVLDAARQESLRTPAGFAFLDGRMRMDIDMSQMKGKSVLPGMVAALKLGGLDRVATIVRPDSKTAYLVFNGAKSYVAAQMSGADAEAAEKNLQIQKSPLGNETVDGHSCARNKVVVKNSKGATLLEAITWNAADLKDFPVKISVQAKDNTTTVLKFAQIQMAKPAAAQFEPPVGYARYNDMEDLMTGASQKLNTPKPTAAPTRPKNVQPPGAVTKK